ncbi:MAG: flagellar hook-basal body complex protein [Proteobacteria bacterium]|nr:flagellar hook-basal body complex protein [Pseudomonadota bacterium]MBU1596282.1 flagellar hook-basal body complex protein [Pseudomonadota bacterium]
MSLSSSLYQGITGLQAHSEKISVIGNNLANVSTVGFKGANILFEDVMSQDTYTSAGVAQVGRGVRVAAIYSDFAQGSFETTTEATDMAIGGSGFFTVKPKSTDNQYYTRAGDFRFDKDGYLTDPHGYVVQGWAMQKASTAAATGSSTSSSTDSFSITGSPADIRINNFQSPPEATSKVSVITNLDPNNLSKSNSSTNPYFAMFNNWNGTNSTPISGSSYGYSSTLKVYDEVGASHNLTTYYDQVTLSNAGGNTVWEFMVTCSPSEDGRTLSGAGGAVSMNATSGAGVLMIGTLTFRAGQLVGESAYTLKSGAGGAVKDLSAWKLADFSTGGYPLITPNFIQASGASLATSTTALPIEINFGIRATDLTSNGAGVMGWSQAKGTISTDASAVGNKISNVGWVPSMKNPSIDAMTTQSYDTGGSSTLFQSQNGYTAGFLQSISVSRDGVLTGRYSNGQVLDLYSLTLTSFTNQWGMRREGGNLFSETRESGPALTGQANSPGKGTIASNTLEQSNVDMGSEFVKMITAQRGFQANTKVITTADSMLGEIIAMKR